MGKSEKIVLKLSKIPLVLHPK